MDKPSTLIAAVKFFAVPENCLQYLVARRWPNGVACPVCGSDRVYFDKSRMGWKCKTQHPKRKFSLKTGTIFEDSPLGLDKWLPAVWMIANMKNGVSSHELARSIGVTQKTAWFMLHRVRLAMQNIGGGKLGGDVEADETFIGGKARNMHFAKRKRLGITQGRSMAGKVAVLGLLERNAPEKPSRIILAQIPNNKRRHLMPHVQQHVETGATVHTDSLPSYVSLEGQYVHKVIDHAEAYVDGEVHTNGVENFWSLLKRSIKGTYVCVEPFHLFRYLDEQAFRFNNRGEMNDADRFSIAITQIVGRRLTYAELIGPSSVGSTPS